MAQVSASSSFPLTNMAGSSYATHHYLSSATGAPTSISNDSRSLHLQAQQGLPGVNVVPFSNPSLSSYPTPARDDQDASNKRLIRDAPVPMAFAQSNLSLAGPSRNQGPTAASAKGQRVPNPFVMPTDQVQQVRRRRRPPISYAGLIAQAINSSPEGRLTLREIYQWIAQQYPQLYPMAGPESHGWQNTVRHNLSLNKAFKKQPRTSRDVPDSPSASAGTKKKGSGTASNRKGKGGFWVLDPVRGAALLNAASKSEHLHEEGIDRERNGNGLASSSRLHCTDSGTSTETSANLLSSQTSLPSTNSFPSVLLPRPRTGSPSESNSTLPRSISATGSSLGQPTAPMSSSFYSLSIPPSPHTAPLQHSMYSSIPVDATGRPRGYTIGTTDQGRDPSWFAGSMAAQHAGATSFSPSPYNMPQYAAEMPAGSNGFGTALMDQRGSERYGTRARNQTTTGIPTAVGTSSFSSAMLTPHVRGESMSGSAQHHLLSLQSQAPWYPQRLGQPQWSLSTSSASKLSGGPVMGMGNGMGGGSAHGVGDASAAAVPRATGDGLLGRGGPFRGYDTANAVTSGSGTRTTLSTHLITSSGDTPAIQFPPAGTTSSAYGMSSLDHEGGAAGGGNGGRMASHHAPPNQSSWQTHNHPMGMFTAKDDEGLGSTGHGHGHQHAHGHSVGAASQPRSQDGRPAAGYDWPSSARPQFSRG